MIVHYDEEHFSIKLYRDFVEGKLVGLMEVIPIDELLEVWEKHKAEQTEPSTEEDAKCPFEDPIPCEWVGCPNSKDCPWR